jgi:transcriptional regulator NrdR family protein
MHESTTPPAGPEAHVGFRCRQCGHQRFYVIYTRRVAGAKVVRRRECRPSGRRFTTLERALSS